MSDLRPLDLLEKFYEAETVFFGSGGSDFARVAAMLDDNVTVRQAAGLPWSGEYVGRDQFREMFGAMAAQWKELRVISDGASLMEGTDSVAVLTRIEAVTHDGEPFSTPFCQVFRFRDGVIVEIWPFWWDTTSVTESLKSGVKG